MKDNFEDKVLWNQIQKDVYKKIKKRKKIKKGKKS